MPSKKDNMTDNEITEMLEESWYWSTIEDIIILFNQHGKDNVLREVDKLLKKREKEKQT